MMPASILRYRHPYLANWAICIDTEKELRYFCEMSTGFCSQVDPMSALSQDAVPVHLKALAPSRGVFLDGCRGRSRSLSPLRKRSMRHTYGRIDCMPDVSHLVRPSASPESPALTSAEQAVIIIEKENEERQTEPEICQEVAKQEAPSREEPVQTENLNPASDDDSTVSCDGSFEDSAAAPTMAPGLVRTERSTRPHGRERRPSAVREPSNRKAPRSGPKKAVQRSEAGSRWVKVEKTKPVSTQPSEIFKAGDHAASSSSIEPAITKVWQVKGNYQDGVLRVERSEVPANKLKTLETMRAKEDISVQGSEHSRATKTDINARPRDRVQRRKASEGENNDDADRQASQRRARGDRFQGRKQHSDHRRILSERNASDIKSNRRPHRPGKHQEKLSWKPKSDTNRKPMPPEARAA